jgi:20S proteasome subunit alpha 4
VGFILRGIYLSPDARRSDDCFGWLLLGLGLMGVRKANAIGRSSKTVREFLERNFKDGMSRDETIKLTIKSLLEVVQTGAKNIEIAILEKGKPLEVIFLQPIMLMVAS